MWSMILGESANFILSLLKIKLKELFLFVILQLHWYVYLMVKNKYVLNFDSLSFFVFYFELFFSFLILLDSFQVICSNLSII